jgi:peptidyl-tRNA hydrolase, PTH1 family
MQTLIIGLGNPGKKFENTRHNVGFMALNKFAKKHSFPDFELNKKSNSFVSENGEIVLAKPQTFMNESGKAVKELIKNKSVENLVVIHDDIDLPIGKIKIVKDRGSAGHKGVESIIQNIGNDGVIRIRIGIGGDKDVEAMKIVLKKFSKDEQKIIDDVISKTADAVKYFVANGLEKTMNEYNG